MPIACVNGTNIHYNETGSGIPIVFVHPPLLTSKNFTYQHEMLSDQYRVISFDIRGHGHSDPSPEPIHYQLISDDIIGLMDELGIEKSFICGYSTGGTITLETMLTYPERFYGGIQISTMPEVSDIYLKNKIRLAVFLSKIKAKKLLTWAISAGNAANKSVYRTLYEDAMNGNIRNMYDYYKYSLLYRCTDHLDQLMLPQLLMYGEHDTNFLRYAYMMQQRLPINEVHIISGKSHQIPTKAAEESVRIIRSWIARQRVEAFEQTRGITERSSDQEHQQLPHVPLNDSDFEQPESGYENETT